MDTEDLWTKPLQGVPDLLRERGVWPGPVLRRVGLSAAALADPQQRLGFAQVGRLLQACAVATGCAHFGLLAGQRAGPAAVGVLRELMCYATTLRAALVALRMHLHLHDRGAVLTLTQGRDGCVEMAYVIHHPDLPGMAHIADGALAILLLMLRDALGPRWTPVRANLAQARPRDAGAYRRFFRAPLVFDAPRPSLVAPCEHLDRPIPGADERREAAILAGIARREAQHPLPMALRVKEILSALLVDAEPSAEQVAATLGMSLRTLKRRLADEGTSVTTLRNDLKAALARQLVTRTSMPMTEIAQTLHYAQPAAFWRAFKGWTGTTPQTLRQQAVHEHCIELP